MDNRQGTALTIVQNHKGASQHVLRVNELKLAVHSIANMGIRTSLSDRTEHIFSREHTQDTIAKYNRQVLLPPSEVMVDGGLTTSESNTARMAPASVSSQLAHLTKV
jgi:hypothetical protein